MAGDNINTNASDAGDKQTAGEMQELQSKLNAAAKELELTKVAQGELQRKLEDADKELLSEDYLAFLESKRLKHTEEGTKTTQVNFDEMTPKQIAEHFEGKFKGDLQKASDAMAEQIKSITATIAQLDASHDLALTCIKHPDLSDALDTPPKSRTNEQALLVNTMLDLANENPTWKAEKCYKQAMRDIKEGAEEKANAERAKAEKDRKALTEKGGVTPSSLQGKEMGKDAAAKAAWDATFGSKTSID